MHIPDGFLSGEVNIAGYAVSAAAIVYSLTKVKKTIDDRSVPLMGVTAAFIFAAQMLNFPVAGGTSGHFLGAVLASVLLGPFGGIIVMSLVVSVQCLGFADGGLTALGTNIFNMAIVGTFFGYGSFKLLRSMVLKDDRQMPLAAGIAGWFSIVFAAGFCAAELAVSGTTPLRIALPAMLSVHMLIGIGEGIITAAVVGLVYKYRRDAIYQS